MVTIAHHGYIGNAPLHPSRAFSIALLRLYRTLANRTPQLSIQKFARSLCDLQLVCYIVFYWYVH